MRPKNNDDHDSMSLDGLADNSNHWGNNPDNLSNSSPTLVDVRLNNIDGFDVLLKNEMKLAWAERELTDVKATVKRLRLDLSELQRETTELKDIKAETSVADALRVEVDELEKRKNRLLDDITHKELQLESLGLFLNNGERQEGLQAQKNVELKRIQQEKEELKEANRKLSHELDTIKANYDKVRKTSVEQLDDIYALRKKNIELLSRVDITASRDQLSNFDSKVKDLKKENEQDKVTISRLECENSVVRDTQGKLEVEVGGLKGEMKSLKAERQWHQTEFAKMMAYKNNIGNKQANMQLSHSSHQASERLTRKNAELNEENRMLLDDKKYLKRKLKDLKIDLAWFFANIDMAEAGFRIFACKHDDLSKIPDKENTTRLCSISYAARRFFKYWRDDQYFADEYEDARCCVIQHHEAHERVKQGKGTKSDLIIEQCKSNRISLFAIAH